jgi:hypothetical protein
MAVKREPWKEKRGRKAVGYELEEWESGSKWKFQMRKALNSY